MLENTAIICFGKDWGGDPTSKNHIMRILAEKNQVLWVNSIGLRRPGLNARDLKRLVQKFRRGLGGCVRAARNIHVVNPLVIPLPGIPAVARVNTAIVSATVRATCRRLALNQPIVWSFFPYVVNLVGRLQERVVIYHCVDDYAEFRGVASDSLRRMERQLVGVADLVFTSSELLQRERVEYNPRTFFVPHGVDFAHFSRALDPRLAVPAGLHSVPHPRIGFIGLVADWVDLDLVATAARMRPDWSFVIVGRCIVDVKAVKALPNVRLLGQEPYDRLPAYCREFDVGIIPFRVNALTVRANPLKLREYLAAGLPVVATPLPEVTKYGPLVRIGTTPGEFVAEIEHALHERGESFVEKRLTAMRHESWESRVEEMCGHITDALCRRTPR
jgi:glycosyltransferase involved in cell wall biosynthesis